MTWSLVSSLGRVGRGTNYYGRCRCSECGSIETRRLDRMGVACKTCHAKRKVRRCSFYAGEIVNGRVVETVFYKRGHTFAVLTCEKCRRAATYRTDRILSCKCTCSKMTRTYKVGSIVKGRRLVGWNAARVQRWQCLSCEEMVTRHATMLKECRSCASSYLWNGVRLYPRDISDIAAAKGVGRGAVYTWLRKQG